MIENEPYAIDEFLPGCKPAPDTAEVHRELDPSATCKCVFLMWPGCFQHLGFIDCSPALLAACTFHNAPACNIGFKFFPLALRALAHQRLQSSSCADRLLFGEEHSAYLMAYAAAKHTWSPETALFIEIMRRMNSTSIVVKKTQPMLRVMNTFNKNNHETRHPEWSCVEKHHESTEIPGS